MKEKTSVRGQVPSLQTDPGYGLTQEQVRQRLDEGLDNAGIKTAGKSEKEIILTHCFTFFNLVFLALAVFLALTGSSVKNMTFMMVVFFNTVIGIFQEIRAKRAVEKLTLVAEARLHTLRDGKISQIPSRLLVRDDIVEHRQGDPVCADGILLEGELLVNESLVTGEDAAVSKKPGDSLLSGSFIVAGTGRVRLTAVGQASFANRLAQEARQNPQAAKSGMMLALDKLIRVMGIALIPVGAALFVQQFRFLQLGLQESAEATAAALVGMIPEGLYLLTSVAMAASAIKLSRRRVLVQDMNCIETLARVDVLCVDKTGTITEPEMEFSRLVVLDDQVPAEAVLGAFYGDGQWENETAQAIRQAFPADPGWERLRRIPFTSEKKWAVREFAGRGSFVLGAPDTVLGSGVRQLPMEELAGSRVLLLAGLPRFPEDGIIREARPVALLALHNRIRPSAPETFAYFKDQGVTVKVISGDDPAAAARIAALAGIENADRWVDASTLKTDEALSLAAESCTVFGRVTPEQKKKLVQALKGQGHTVAMTGDGVNDVLALKEADCGIAMASGSQAASQVAKLVLLDSDFGAMPGIVAEGRRVINNIQRAAALFLVKNIFSFFLSCITVFAGLPYPLQPLHLTLISATTIGIPSFFLAMEPNYQRVTGTFLAGALRRAFPAGLTNIAAVLGALVLTGILSVPQGETATLCTAVLAVVGLLALYRISRPMGLWRSLVWCAMALGLLGCFTLLPWYFELGISSRQGWMALGILALATPAVFALLEGIFALGQHIWEKRAAG